MKKVLITVLILGLSFPLISEAVVVERKLEQTNVVKTLRDANIVEVHAPEKVVGYNVLEVKRVAFDYAKKKAYISPEKMADSNSSANDDYCAFFRKLVDMGVQDASFEYRVYDESDPENKIVKLGNRTFRHPSQCAKVTFTFEKKPYEVGWCRSNRPSSIY